MAKLSPQFVKYFIFASLALAFIFPITHSAYEGLENKVDDEEDEDEDYNEYDNEYVKNAKKALSREIIAQAHANISTSSSDVNSRRKLRADNAIINAEEKKQIAITSVANAMKAKAKAKTAEKIAAKTEN